jgi:hypothetical protein
MSAFAARLGKVFGTVATPTSSLIVFRRKNARLVLNRHSASDTATCTSAAYCLHLALKFKTLLAR